MFKILLNKKNVVYIVGLSILLTSCASKEYFPPGKVQKGLASWYGTDFHGKATSSKEIYNMYDMTAAHKNIPFGTYVMVTNLNNGKSVIVRINDRGPFVRGRIIDLSYAAAKMLDIIIQGIAPVKIEVLEKISHEKLSQKYCVQVGAFIFENNAEALKKKLQKKYKNVYITLFETPYQTYYRVRIRANSQKDIQKIAQKLSKDGYTVLLLE